jgi:pseudouridine synthase
MVRLNKFLRDCQLGSRRKCEKLVVGGLVTIDGSPVTDLSTMVDPVASRVEVDGKTVRPHEEQIYIAAYKPRGAIVTASDPRKRRTLYDQVPGLPTGAFAVGRLDMESEGLILLTNDGALSFRLAHPKYAIERIYEVRVKGGASADLADALRQGVVLEDGTARPKAVRVLRETGQSFMLRLTLTEGKKREIRRMIAACGYDVVRLKRVRFAGVALGALGVGRWRHLTRDEVRGLRRLVQDSYVAGLKQARRPRRGAPEVHQ